MYALILAGGTGTRLWPYSRIERPKQFLPLHGDVTMLQETVNRTLPLIPLERVYVATGAAYADLVAEQLPELPRANILVEPCGRGTAPCIGLAALHLRRRDPAAVMAVLSADHCVEHADRLCDALSFGDELAQRGQLVTLGVQPSSPMTGYGYIHQGELVAKRAGLMAHQVAAFEEKPNLQRARDYLASGDYVWNAGIFVWRADRILEELALHSPLVASILMALDKVIGSSVEHSVLHTIWPTIENIAIDIAVMERTAHAVVIPTALGWSDVGDWDAFADTLAPDANGNAVVGTHIGRNTHHSLIYGNKRVVATIGVDDLLIVDTPDVLLVCSRANAQEVKALVAQIREHDSRLL